MVEYTGWQYLLIDVANRYGMDKALFPERIKWAEDNLDNLESFTADADKKPLYYKAVLAIRAAQRGEAIGHMMGLDANASGLQIMGALTGCLKTCFSTGLIDPNKAPDAYTDATEIMNRILGCKISILRSAIKEAIMTFFYGSQAKPIELFGEDTPEHLAFFEAAKELAPGAYALRGILLDSWQAYAEEHKWTLPDGHIALVRVSEHVVKIIEVDELNHATFSHRFKEFIGSSFSLANAANVLHSVDGYVVREMGRRCNYSPKALRGCLEIIANRDPSITAMFKTPGNMVSLVHTETINSVTVYKYDSDFLDRLSALITRVLDYQSFQMIPIHDEFKASPNHMNMIRYWYKEILAEIADSNLLEDILEEIHGQPVTINKINPYVGNAIRAGEYGLG